MRTAFFLTIVIAVTALVLSAEAKKGRSGGARRGGAISDDAPPMPPTMDKTLGVRPVGAVLPSAPNRIFDGDYTVTTWTRTVGATDISQKGVAASKDGREAVYVTSYGAELKEEGLAGSTALYDFDGSDTMLVVKTRTGCYVLPDPTGLTFTSASAEIVARNDTLLTDALTELQLNATGERLNRAERRMLFRNNPNYKFLCAFSPVFSTSPADAASFPAPEDELERGQFVISVVTLDSKVSILNRRFRFRGK